MHARTASGPAVAARAGAIALLLARHAASRAAARLRRAVTRERARPGLPQLLVALGPTFLKAGQVLASRPDLLPPALQAELAVLHTHVPPPRPAAVRRAVEAAYRSRGDWPFRTFDWLPYRSGSVATVHQARLRSGERVAVKVLRPGVATTFAKDYRLVRGLAGAAERLPPGRGIPLARIVDELAGAVGRQTDLEHEASMLTAFGANLVDLPYVRVPRPLPEHGAGGVLVMEFVEGLAPIGTPPPDDPGLAAERCLGIVYQMLFRDGLVHCDLHPGNLTMTAAGDIVLLDTGFAYRLPPRMRRLFAQFFLGMTLGDGDRCATAVIDSADRTSPAFDEAGFRAAMGTLISRSSNLSAGDFSLPRFAASLFDAQRRNGVFSAPEFVFPILSLLVIEGIINRLDVDVSFQQLAVPYVLAALGEPD